MQTRYIVVGICVAVVLFFVGLLVSANNKAIGYEESIKNSLSGIEVQEKRQYDLVTKLVQVVEANSNFEASTQLAIVSARSSLKSGDIAGATMAINVVAEAYPQLGANASYVQLMTELSISENLKAQYRVAYNDNVQGYSRFVRRFPTSMFLSIMGYEVQDYNYLDFDNTELPEELFTQ
jgi:LemA protein